MGAASKFVWHDLMTTHVEDAKKFYGEIFGWKFRSDGKDPYTHVSAGDQDIGGMVLLDKGDKTPASWVGYVGVDDVDVALAAVTKNGGKVFVPKTAIPNVGEFALAGDRQGAAFSPFHYTGPGADAPETNVPPPLYTFCWDELLSSDPDDAAAFYSAIFGWGADRMEMPGFGTYTLLKRTGIKDEMGVDKNAGGLMKAPPGMPVSFWQTYVAVPDTDKLIAKATQNGAQLTVPPMSVPGVGRFAALLDPQKASFAVLAPSTT